MDNKWNYTLESVQLTENELCMRKVQEIALNVCLLMSEWVRSREMRFFLWISQLARHEISDKSVVKWFFSNNKLFLVGNIESEQSNKIWYSGWLAQKVPPQERTNIMSILWFCLLFVANTHRAAEVDYKILFIIANGICWTISEASSMRFPLDCLPLHRCLTSRLKSLYIGAIFELQAPIVSNKRK